MSKLKQLSVWAFAALMPLAMAMPVSAESTCQIGFTGPNSNNQCVSTTTYTCTVTNDNQVTVDNQNVQITLTGNASNSGNTSGGSSQSGSSTNNNNVTFTATVDNTEQCSVVATVPATQTPVGGSGAAAPVSVKEVVRPAGGAGAAAPTKLANTGSIELLPLSISMLSASALIFVLAKLYISSRV